MLAVKVATISESRSTSHVSIAIHSVRLTTTFLACVATDVGDTTRGKPDGSGFQNRNQLIEAERKLLTSVVIYSLMTVFIKYTYVHTIVNFIRRTNDVSFRRWGAILLVKKNQVVEIVFLNLLGKFELKAFSTPINHNI
eukprot:TRINITY_DN2647_c2_g1_i3.p3 TRINITY_DN2647_c2_g1~~TRINITY_DN2647_c2_g1_i3.p3  ORF type:complete len:139 (-),score=1.91 TRINITY_DN2647_c2_g1_i3:70-486(-)